MPRALTIPGTAPRPRRAPRSTSATAPGHALYQRRPPRQLCMVARQAPETAASWTCPSRFTRDNGALSLVARCSAEYVHLVPGPKRSTPTVPRAPPLQRGHCVRGEYAAVERPRLQDEVTGAARVHVGQHVVVAQDQVLAGPLRPDVADQAAEGACRDVVCLMLKPGRAGRTRALTFCQRRSAAGQIAPGSRSGSQARLEAHVRTGQRSPGASASACSRRATGHSPPEPAKMLTVIGSKQSEAH